MSVGSSETPLTVEQVEALVEEKLAERQADRRRQDNNLPAEPLLWLALVRQWTEPLLAQVTRRLLGKSWDRERTAQLINDLVERSALDRSSAPSLPERPAPLALLTLDPLTADERLTRTLENESKDDLWSDIVGLGDAILEVADSPLSDTPAVPQATIRWATLAAAGQLSAPTKFLAIDRRPRVTSWEPAARLLQEKVEESSLGTAQRWLEAAQPLAAVLARTLDTTLDIALRRASLNLELRDRRRYDLQHLNSFEERDDQLAILRRLIRPSVVVYDDPTQDHDPEDPVPWALHLLGGGGVGKTMLVRYLTSHLADEKHWSLTIARVDFDYLSPDYPRRDPGLLLWAFAQELRVFDRTGSADQAFDASHRQLSELQDVLRSGESLENSLDHPLLVEGIEIYAQALELLPQPVVLVIDTCEELTKPRAGKHSHFNVEATFHILEELHRHLPSLKVVFAGRRPLARAGAGWRCDHCELPPRPYLALFEMVGFRRDEAQSYLNKENVPPHLIDAVIRRSSPDTGRVAKIRWIAELQPMAVSDEERCNPYELNFFAKWAQDTPPPSPEDIENAGGERYVELRILQRLTDPNLEKLLPVLGVVRHFDMAFLRQLSGLEGDPWEAFELDLREQEWLQRRTQQTSGQSRRILSIEDGLHLRLVSYFQGRMGDLQPILHRAADILRRRTLETDLADLDTADFDAALRVLGYFEGADLWWRDVERRLFIQRDPPWVMRQMALLEGAEGAVCEPDASSWPELRTEHPLRPAVLATKALAESRHETGGGLTPWMEVAEKAIRLPNIGADLTLRAQAMELALRQLNGEELAPRDGWDLWQRIAAQPTVPSPDTAAALVAAAEAVVEYYETRRHEPGAEAILYFHPPDEGAVDDSTEATSDKDSEPDQRLGTSTLCHRLTEWARAAEPPWTSTLWCRHLQAMAMTLDGRARSVSGHSSETVISLLFGAWKLALDNQTVPDVARLPQTWLAPNHFTTRLQTEAIRALYPSVLSPSQCYDRFGSLDGPSDGLERDRFLAALAELALAEGPQSRLFPVLRGADLDDPDWTLRNRVHIETPPLVVQKARLNGAKGNLGLALQQLDDVIRRADTFDVTELEHAARSRLRLAIRLRRFEDRPGRALAESQEPTDHALIGLATALGHSPLRLPGAVQQTRQAMHRHWQTLKEPDGAACQEIFQVAQKRLHHDLEDLDAIDAHLVLDGWEASQLDAFGLYGLESSGPFSLDTVAPLVRSAIDGSRQPQDVWCLFLRQQALSRWREGSLDTPQTPLVLDDLATSLAKRLGKRRAALLAWHEAELLALRLPAAAANLFAVARWLLERADDTVGEAICLTAQCHCLAGERREDIPSWHDELKACWNRLGYNHLPETKDSDDPLSLWWIRAQLLLLQAEDGSTAAIPAAWRRRVPFDAEPMLAWLDAAQPDVTRGVPPLPKGPDWDEITGAFSIGETMDGEPMDPAPLDDSDLSGGMPPSPPPPSPPSASSLPSEPGTVSHVDAERGGFWASLSRTLPNLMAGIVGAVFATGFVGLMVFAARWRGTILGVEVPGYAILLVILLLVFGIASAMGISRAWRRLGRPLAAFGGAPKELELQLDVEPSLEASCFDVNVTATTILRRWPWRRRRMQSLPVMQWYRLQMERQRVGYADQLSTAATPVDLDALNITAGQVIVLQLSEYPHLPWEGVLAESSSHPSLRFRRHVTRQPRRSKILGQRPEATDSRWPTLDDTSDDDMAIRLGCRSKLFTDLARQAWRRPKGSAFQIFQNDFTEVLTRSTEVRPTERVVHLIGVVIETRAGLRFRLQGSDDDPLDIRAEDLVTAFPQLNLLVLQETPVSEMHPRSSADRRQAGYLRGFAAEAQMAGIAVVVTVPHMMPTTAVRCIEELATLLVPYSIRLPQRLMDSDPSLLDTIDAIREHIRLDSEMADEAAWDVVLHAPPGWHNPFRRTR